jgi:hypothetical protein
MGFDRILEWCADKIDKAWNVIARIIIYGILLGVIIGSIYLLYSMGVIKLDKSLPECSTLNITNESLVCESDKRIEMTSVYINSSSFEQNKTYICKKIDPLSPNVYPDYLKCYQMNLSFNLNMKQICKAYC